MRPLFFKKLILKCVVILVGGCGLDILACSPAHATDPYPTTSGRTASLDDFKGSVVFLHFFASWCGECILEAPSLVALSESLDASRIRVVGVSLDSEPIAAKAMAEQFGFSFPVLIDTHQTLKKKFAVRGVPMSVVLDSRGVVAPFVDPKTGRKVMRVDGPRDWSRPAVKESLEAIARAGAG
jgi:thiol-disulfide isomerase/thioredoxin